jgi:hypothetical protein
MSVTATAIKAKAIALWLVSLTPAYKDPEPAHEREARLAIYGDALAYEAERLTCTGQFAPTPERPCSPSWRGTWQSLVVAVGDHGWHESKLARNIQEGKCRPLQCDPLWLRDPKGRYVRDEAGKKVRIHTSRSVFQLKATTPAAREVWNRMLGPDREAVFASVYAATRFFVIHQCKGDILKTLSSGSGQGCIASPRGRERHEFYRQELPKFQALYSKVQLEAK